MWSSSKSRSPLTVAVVGLILALALAAGGCATSGESDLPWNSPQSWEGSPFIPGLSE